MSGCCADRIALCPDCGEELWYDDEHHDMELSCGGCGEDFAPSDTISTPLSDDPQRDLYIRLRTQGREPVGSWADRFIAEEAELEREGLPE